MGTSTTLLLLVCIVTRVSSSMNDYLDEKLRQSKVEIAKLHIQDVSPERAKSYKVHWEKLWEEPLAKERSFALNIFDKTVVLEGNRLMTLSFDPRPRNDTSVLRNVAVIRGDDSVKFVRSIVWNDMVYLLVCYETGSCSLYTGTDNLQLRHRQTVQHRGFPMDASFFIHANRLYLVVADNSGQFTVPSVIYHWMGTYMDVIAEAMTTAAVSVTTFQHKQSTIIIFAQNDRKTPQIGSVVYEFKETSLDGIQFLPTVSPTSVRHYNHDGFNFILVVNELAPSTLFWWDGRELLNWLQLPDIASTSLIRIVRLIGETFFFVGHRNSLQLYKIQGASDCTRLGSLDLKDDVIDMTVRIDGSNVIVVLLIEGENDVYIVEPWELEIKEAPHEDSKKEIESPSKCLADLIEILQKRMPLVKESQSSWPSLFSSTEDLTITEPLNVPNLILESGTVREIDVQVEQKIIPPSTIEQNLKILDEEIDEALSTSKEIKQQGGRNFSTNRLVVLGDVELEELLIDSVEVEFLNNVDLRGNEDSVSVEDVDLSRRFRENNEVPRDLQIDFLCGIPVDYWALKNDTTKMHMKVDDSVEFSENLVTVRSNLSFFELRTEILNHVDVDKFFDELFLLNSNQKIEGNVTFKNILKISNLTTENLNGESIEDYVTRTTDQTLPDFFVKTIEIKDLHVDRINNVSVSDAARIDRENTIKGELTISRLRVTESLSTDSDLSPPTESLQIYSNVTIHGNVRIRKIDLDRGSIFSMKNEEVRLDEIFETHWTKSTDQSIESKVTFNGDLTIDRLDADHINGFSPEEFLYTTCQEIPESFRNLRFQDFRASNFLLEGEKKEEEEEEEEEEKGSNFFVVTSDSLIVQKSLHLQNLRVNDLLVGKFNEIPINEILSDRKSVNLSGNTFFPTIRAKTVRVVDLDLDFLNKKEFSTSMERKNLEDVEHDFRNVELIVEDLRVERINNIDMRTLISLKDKTASSWKDLVIDGDLTVTRDLRVQTIDHSSTEYYLQRIAENDITITSEELIENLTVQNLTVNFLHGLKVDRLILDTLSRSRDQRIPGQFSFYQIASTDTKTDFVNDVRTSDIIWTDESFLINGNVTFQDLFVDEDIVTGTLNGLEVSKLYENLLHVPLTNIEDLTIHGNISWTLPSSNLESLSFLLENAVTTNDEQIIRSETIFETDVSVSEMTGNLEEFDLIKRVITDAVIDDERCIEVFGRKVFQEDLTIDDLSVGDLGVSTINGVDVVDFNDSIARLYESNFINGTVVFLDEVSIEEMIVDDVRGAPIDGVALATDNLTNGLIFDHLEVLQDIYLKNLDGVDFDDFVEQRFTLDGDQEIFPDVQFKGIVEVTEHAEVAKINGVRPSDLVLNGAKETQYVSGTKIFEKDLIVTENVNSPVINDIDVLSEFKEGIQNDEDVEIFGDITFETQVKLPRNVSVSERINGIDHRTIFDDTRNQTREIFRVLKENETLVDEEIKTASQISETLSNIFLYLEEERRLRIRVPNVKKVDVVHMEETTKLNLHAEEAGIACGLPARCSCPIEYVAELSSSDCRAVKRNGTVIRNFHEGNGIFGVNVNSRTFSSNENCVSANVPDEYTTISWMTIAVSKDGNVAGNVRESSLRIPGFLKDAQVFMHNYEAFIVLAMNFDPLSKTHRTDTVVYRLNFEKDELSVQQKIHTDGAWDVQVFKSNYYHGTYLLIGCFGDSSKSLLYRFDPITSKFVLLRTFFGRSRNAKNLSQDKDLFVLLDNFDTNAVHVYRYDPRFKNFYDYQNLFHDSTVSGIETFHADDYGNSDSFVIVTTEDGHFYIYEYMLAQKFQLKLRHWIEDLQTMMPFYYSGRRYVFVGTRTNSTILRIVQQGPH